MIENLKDKVFKDLNGLTKVVNTMFVKMESLKKNDASTFQLSSSHDGLSHILDMVNDNLDVKIYSFHNHLSSNIDFLWPK